MSELLSLMEQQGAQELRFQAGTPPLMFLHGRARPLEVAALSGEDVEQLFRTFASPEQMNELQTCGDAHFIYATKDSARFNVTAKVEREQITFQIRNLRI